MTDARTVEHDLETMKARLLPGEYQRRWTYDLTREVMETLSMAQVGREIA